MRVQELLSESTQFSQRPDWVNLGEGMSVEDKISIFESYYAKGIVLESDDHNVTYFKGLSKFSVIPKKGNTYIVTPLMLIQNRVVSLNTDLLKLKFLSQKEKSLVFSKDDGSTVTFPNDFAGEQGLSHTFVFDNNHSYDQFRSAVMMKFNLSLPPINNKVKESASAGATSSGSVASAPAQGGGWLFGGTVGAPKGKKKKAKVIKRS